MAFSKSTIKKFKEFEKDIETINKYIIEIRDMRVSTVDPRGEKIKQRPIWNLQSYVQLAIHRVYDLAVESTTAWNNARPVVAFILTRAIYENTAYMYDLAQKLKMYYDQDNYKEIHNVIVNRLVGNRLGTTAREIINVLTAIGTVAKEIPEFKQYYDFISDFSHPNYSGMYGIYSETDKENVRFFVSRKYGYTDQIFSFIITGLATGLGIFINSTNNILNNIDELNDFFYKHQPLVNKGDTKHNAF